MGLQKNSWVSDLFGIDLRTLAVVRIVAAITVLATLAILFQDVTEFFTDDGIYPRDHWLSRSQNPFWVSFHMIRGELWWQVLLFAVQVVLALMLLVGYKTRFASIATWILMVSLFNRTPPIDHRGDTLLCLLLLWGALTPWAARFSVDAALNTVKEFPTRVTSFATAGLILQMPLVYFVSVLLKLEDGSWRFPDMTAVFYSLSPEYVTPFGAWLVQIQPFWATQAKTVFTLVAEGVGPLLMFFIFVAPGVRHRWLPRLRWIAIGALTLMQLGLAVTVAVGLFPLISTLGLLPALPATLWDRWSRTARVQRASQTTIFFHPDCGFCKKAALLIRQLLLPNSTAVLPASADPTIVEEMTQRNSWIVRDGEGALHDRYGAFLLLISVSPWAFVLYYPLRALSFVGDPLYRWIAENRNVTGHLTQGLEFRPYRVRAGLVVTLLSALLMTNMLYSNVDSVVYGSTGEWHSPVELRRFQRSLRIHQNWRMFVSPYLWSNYYVIHGTLLDGTEVQLFAGGPIHLTPEPMAWDPPSELRSYAIYKNYRWRLYLQTIRDSTGSNDRGPYASYVCRTWNQHHSGDERLDTLRFYRMVRTRDLLRDPFLDEAEQRLLWRHWCFGRPADDQDD